jgi:hypothetical protein
MPAFLNHHAKARARSVQLDKNLDNKIGPDAPMVSLQEYSSSSLAPAPRFSGLISQENQTPSIRHYRSMLVVDAPSLGPLKPMSYDELYVHSTAGTTPWRGSCNVFPGIPIILVTFNVTSGRLC